MAESIGRWFEVDATRQAVADVDELIRRWVRLGRGRGVRAARRMTREMHDVYTTVTFS